MAMDDADRPVPGRRSNQVDRSDEIETRPMSSSCHGTGWRPRGFVSVN
jgi:hypothetical protein